MSSLHAGSEAGLFSRETTATCSGQPKQPDSAQSTTVMLQRLQAAGGVLVQSRLQQPACCLGDQRACPLPLSACPGSDALCQRTLRQASNVHEQGHQGSLPSCQVVHYSSGG